MSEMVFCPAFEIHVPEGSHLGRVYGECAHTQRAREIVEAHIAQGLRPPIMGGGARCGCVTPEVIGCQCTGQSSNTVALSGAATAANPWQWDLILDPAADNVLTASGAGLHGVRIDPAAGNRLQVTGAGLFVPPVVAPDAGLVDIVAYNSDGNFQKAGFPGIRRVLVYAQGGGGAGGGAAATGSNQSSGGAGGGGGGCGIRLVAEASLSASETVTVGGGGSGSTGTGGSGSASSFGSHASGSGGGGGDGTGASQDQSAPAGGGTGGGFSGQFGIHGGDGINTAIMSRVTTLTIGENIKTGSGGGSAFGNGRRAPLGVNSVGLAGRSNTGEGGSGANNGMNQSAVAGGGGGTGRVIVFVYGGS